MLLCQTQDLSRDIFFWLGAIVVAGIVLGIVALVLRKLLLGGSDAPTIGFTLADIRQLHESGELSDEEFALAKGQMVAQNRAMLADDEPENDAEPGPADAVFGEESVKPVDESAPDGPSPDKNL